MITLDLTDKHLKENLEAIEELRSFGYSDEQIQEFYDRQVKADQMREGESNERN